MAGSDLCLNIRTMLTFQGPGSDYRLISGPGLSFYMGTYTGFMVLYFATVSFTHAF